MNVKVDDSKYSEVYNAYVQNGAVELTDGFTGVGSSGDGNGFNEGDVISLPETAKVLGQKIQGSDNVAEMIIVKVTNGSQVRYQPFYPKSLAKRTNCLTLDDKKVVIKSEYKKASGTAAEWYQSQSGRKVQDIVNDLIAMNKDIKVTEVKQEQTYRFRSTDIITSNVYKFDFV